MIKSILDKNCKYYTIIYVIFQYLDKNILTAFKLHYKIPATLQNKQISRINQGRLDHKM